ncbi:c-type cytochrome [Undibacterium sp. TJN25]|uniref:c-type cytochrome n=1 Tax=Undibacterium sp. TJN25 TaxID=3413056 RepID=UPI003BF34005
MARMIAWMLFSCALPALAQAAADTTMDTRKAAQRLAASCAGCHGTTGVAVGNSLPPLAGQSSAGIITSMQAFKSGARPSTVMQQLAKGYTDEQVAQIAAYFSALKPVPARGEK